MQLTDFDYDLPESFIAQTPAEPRDSSRLLTLNRQTGELQHCVFGDIFDLIQPDDVLVLNTTRVIPARLNAIKAETGGAVEILLLEQVDDRRWKSLVGGKNVNPGITLTFPGKELTAEVVETAGGAERIVSFSQPLDDLLDQIGEVPLPPYIHQQPDDPERYQTVYNRQTGSAAAPTAGLHFTPDLLIALRQKGVRFANCVLHIGLDTFQPVKAEQIEEHKLHSERALLSADDARIINEVKLGGGRVIAVGTTVARTLETAAILSGGGDPAKPHELPPDACPWRPVIAFERSTDLYIYPGYHWRVVDGMITNFHLPRSTLLMMVSAFAGRENVLRAYETAKSESYRFYSFGDAMFIA